MQYDKDINMQLYFASADNIGSYAMPVIYTSIQPLIEESNVLVELYQEVNTISGIQNIAFTYRYFEPPKMNDVMTSLVEFSANNTISGALNRSIIYSTGYNAISGTLDRRVAFTGGRIWDEFVTIASAFSHSTSKSGIINILSNYTDFSGNIGPGGILIPFHIADYDFITEYGEEFDNFNQGWSDGIVDVSFAGWVGFPVYIDVYSTLLGFEQGYYTDITVISGEINVNYLDIFSTLPSTSGIYCDVYCALISYSSILTEVELIPGGIYYTEVDVYSTVETKNTITMSVDLYSLKITNFSLDIGEYTTSSGIISVDILDDECPISVSGTYFMVDGVQVSSTLSGIDSGYRMFYDPEDDFTSLEGPTTFTVHAENECGKILEQDFYLTFGYIVEYINRPELSGNMDYGFGHKIAVRVVAENYASCPQVSSLAWEFESKSQFNNDLGASIIGRFHAWDYNDMLATIYPQSTAYFYGKEFRVVVKAKDFAGNQMEPLILAYRIEDKP
jgi:hypothetical protein